MIFPLDSNTGHLPQQGGRRLCTSFINNPQETLKLVSIVTVVLNAASTISTLIASVKNRPNNIEFVIIDGGSTDGTLDIIRNNDEIIDYWISEPDEGIYDAMNKSLELVSGKWVIFLGSDDQLLADLSKITIQFKFGTSYYGNVRMKKSGSSYDGQFSRYRLILQNICQQAIFYDVHLLKMRRFNLKYKIASDYDMNLYLFGQGAHLTYLNEEIAIFNDEGLSSTKTDLLFKSDFRKLIFSYYPRMYIIIYFFGKAHYIYKRSVYYFRKYFFSI